MELNLPLARKVYEHITAHRAEFGMREWAVKRECGTTMCIAGHAVTLAGYELAFRQTPMSHIYGEHASEVVDGRDIEEVARQLLGLDQVKAWNLFHIPDNETAIAALGNLIEEAERV